MKTFRIITNGERYRVQRKGLLGWSTLIANSYSGRAVEFPSKAQAEAFIVSQATPKVTEKWVSL